MILPLLLFLMALSPTAAFITTFTPCPKDSACLYHSRCTNSSSSVDSVLATSDLAAKYNDWKNTQCNGQAEPTSELFIRPLSNRKWDITWAYTVDYIRISIGNLVTVKADFFTTSLIAGGSVKTEQNEGEKIYHAVVKHNEFTFNINAVNGTNFLDAVAGIDIYYYDSNLHGQNTSSKQDDLWKTLRQLTPCDTSLIIDDCGEHAKNCTHPEIGKEEVQCLNGMWLKSADSTWQQLDPRIVCSPTTKEWTITKKNGAPEEFRGEMKIRCAVEEPSPCDDYRVIDDCTNDAKNCTALNVMKDYAVCESEGNMWLQTFDKQWTQLKEVTCNKETKAWSTANEEGKIQQHAWLFIRCAVEEPEPWRNNANNILHVFVLPIVLYCVLM